MTKRSFASRDEIVGRREALDTKRDTAHYRALVKRLFLFAFDLTMLW
jgi:hypothetical protein